MALHVIVGKGPVGTTTATELIAKGHDVRVLSRSGDPSTAEVEHRQVDATDADALAAASRGAAALYNAVNPAYTGGRPTGRPWRRPCCPLPSAPAPSS